MKSSFVILILRKNCSDGLGLLRISTLVELKHTLLCLEPCSYPKECEPTTQVYETTLARKNIDLKN